MMMIELVHDEETIEEANNALVKFFTDNENKIAFKEEGYAVLYLPFVVLMNREPEARH
jgi:hypothetical protein